MDMATLLAGASLLIGIAGAGLGFHGFQKRKEMEQRLQRKEELERLSDELQELHDRISTACNWIVSPRQNVDIDLVLYDMARDVFSYSHTANETAVLMVRRLKYVYMDERDDVVLNNPKKVVEILNRDANAGYVRATVHVKGSEDVLPYRTDRDIDSGLRGIAWVHIQLEKIQSTQGDLLDRFDASLIDDTKESLDVLTIACFEQLFDSYEGVKFNPNDYDSPTELENAIYREFILSDDVRAAVDDLQQIANRTGEIQKTVIGTSFS